MLWYILVILKEVAVHEGYFLNAINEFDNPLQAVYVNRETTWKNYFPAKSWKINISWKTPDVIDRSGKRKETERLAGEAEDQVERWRRVNMSGSQLPTLKEGNDYDIVVTNISHKCVQTNINIISSHNL